MRGRRAVPDPFVALSAHLMRWALWHSEAWVGLLDGVLARPWWRSLLPGEAASINFTVSKCRDAAKQLHGDMSRCAGISCRSSLPELCYSQRCLRILETDIGQWLPASADHDVLGGPIAGTSKEAGLSSDSESFSDGQDAAAGRVRARDRVALAMQAEMSESIPSESGSESGSDFESVDIEVTHEDSDSDSNSDSDSAPASREIAADEVDGIEEDATEEEDVPVGALRGVETGTADFGQHPPPWLAEGGVGDYQAQYGTSDA